MTEGSVHDNNIYAYAVLCEKRQLVLHTEYRDGGAEEYTDVTFSGVVAHYFEHALSGNILFSIDAVDVEQIVSNWAGLLAAGKNYGWPEGIEYRDAADLVSILRQRGIAGYEVSSSYGLGGWVLAKDMSLCSRSERYAP